MVNKIKVACVSYLNTKPLIFGLQKEKYKDQFELILADPAACAELYRNNEVDIALVPTAALNEELGAYEIISDFCIGSEGPVDTVGIFSDAPLIELDKVYLDGHSRTSQNLTKIIFEDYLVRKPEYQEVDVSQVKLRNNEGVLMIGDKAFEAKSKYKYFFDLAEMWTTFTGLPFVFAVWIGRSVSAEVRLAFNDGLLLGLENIDKVIAQNIAEHPDLNLNQYYTEHIKFHLDQKKRDGLELFLNKLQTIGSLSLS